MLWDIDKNFLKIDLNIEKYPCGPVSTNCFLVYDDSGEGVIIDAPMNSFELISNFLLNNKIKIKLILLTHSHWDHTADAAKLKRLTGADILVHKNDEYRLKNMNENTLIPLPFNLESIKADGFVEDGDILNFGDIFFKVLHTPGHTEGGVCYVFENNKKVFSGDTLFRESVGRVDLPGGNAKLLINSIKDKLFTYDDEFKVYCGHGAETTIGFERMNNPFVGHNLMYAI